MLKVEHHSRRVPPCFRSIVGHVGQHIAHSPADEGQKNDDGEDTTKPGFNDKAAEEGNHAVTGPRIRQIRKYGRVPYPGWAPYSSHPVLTRSGTVSRAEWSPSCMAGPRWGSHASQQVGPVPQSPGEAGAAPQGALTEPHRPKFHRRDVPMSTPIIVGNWKMNGLSADSVDR